MAYNLFRADFSSEAGARQLQEHLEQHWRDKGHDVKFRLEMDGTRHHTMWCIRSDLVGGLPRKEDGRRSGF